MSTPGQLLRLSDRLVDLTTGDVAGHGRIRPTERALLAYFADRIGAWIDMDELHTQVWGYTPNVQSRAAYASVNRLRAFIETDPAAPRHLVAERGAGYRLVDAERIGTPQLPTLTNLAVPDVMFGREAELARLAGSPSRLWTIVGPGGVGKTRLAIEVGRREPPSGGVWFCDLQLARSAEDLDATVGQALPKPTIGTVVERLRQLGDVLIVLDNLEQVDGAAARIHAWLDDVPTARFLATSREPLGLVRERVLRLGPLPREEGVALLGDRMARDGTGVPLGEEVAGALWELVDGLPLALEIVAANVALLGVHGVMDRLRAGRDLRSRRTDGPGRHWSLDEVLLWSWERLLPESRRALGILATLDGAFGLPTAEVALDDPDAVTRVADLVDASLLAPAGDSRFFLLSTVRSAVRRWEPIPVSEVLDRLLQVRIDGARGTSEPAFRAPRPVTTSLAGLGQLVDHLAQRTDLAPDLAAHVVSLLVEEGVADGVRPETLLVWLDRALRSSPSDPVASALLLQRGQFASQSGQVHQAIADVTESAVRARRSGRLVVALTADRYRAACLALLGRDEEALALADVVEEGARALGPEDAQWFAGQAHLLRATIAGLHGDDGGEGVHRRSAAAAFRAGGHIAMAEAVEIELVRLFINEGRTAEAGALLRASERASWRSDEFSCFLLFHQGRFEEMVDFARRAVTRKFSTRELEQYASALTTHGIFALHAGALEDGRAWLRARLRLPARAPWGLASAARCRSVLRLLDDGPRAAWPDLVEERAAAEVAAQIGWIPEIAVDQGEIAWALGQLGDAVVVLGDCTLWHRPLAFMLPALLLAETRLRLGERDLARALAHRVLASRVTPVARARAHAILATCAAVERDATEATDQLRRTGGVRGPGAGWLAVHTAWVGALLEARPPEAVAVEPLPLELALAVAVAELTGPSPTWTTKI